MINPRSIDVVKLAETGGNDAHLVLLDKVHSLEDSVQEEVKKLDTKIDDEIESVRKDTTQLAEDIKHVQTIKGDKGDSPTEDELLGLIKPLIPKPIAGKDGKDGRTPLYVGKEPPMNPKKGDLWYQD